MPDPRLVVRIWLNRANVFLIITTNTFQWLVLIDFRFFLELATYRELRPGSRGSSISFHQLPNQMVQGRSQVVGEFAYPDGPIDRRVGIIAEINPPNFVAIFFWNDQP